MRGVLVTIIQFFNLNNATNPLVVNGQGLGGVEVLSPVKHRLPALKYGGPVLFHHSAYYLPVHSPV